MPSQAIFARMAETRGVDITVRVGFVEIHRVRQHATISVGLHPLALLLCRALAPWHAVIQLSTTPANNTSAGGDQGPAGL